MEMVNLVTASMISLGCSKNLVDAEYMSSILVEDGIRITNNLDEATVIIVNTCGFIEAAKQEAIDTILEMADYKNNATCDFLLVTGCLAQRYSKEIADSLPEVDAILGTSSYKDIASVIKELYRKNGDGYADSSFGRGRHSLAAGEELDSEVTLQREGTGKQVLTLAEFQPASALSHLRGKRLLSTGHFAYLKIAEGCSNTCTFCAIPKIRGPYQSRPIEDILAEAQNLADAGVKELILVAQDTTAYGVDRYGHRRLPELLLALADMPFSWIRFLYAYTDGLTDELLEAMASRDNILNYIDLPIQHASDRLLKRMGRTDNQAFLRERLTRARSFMPDVTLRTTVIVAFPGETEEELDELISFINEIKFDMLGSFIYSPEEDTPAERLPDRILDRVAELRQERLMRAQREILADMNRRHLEKTYPVLIEGISDDGFFYKGRCAWQAPEVDSLMYVLSEDSPLEIGSLVDVRVIQADEYEFTGVSVAK